ncbi:hypothetical protein [Streptomyces sp. NPDC002490]|uniref:hypothetical protein n=1 Tax=Streptomyces sp. NPDC002490 TaxID=3154416 RepID=UPI00332B4967
MTARPAAPAMPAPATSASVPAAFPADPIGPDPAPTGLDVDPSGPDLVAEYATGLATTRVWSAGDGSFWWWQRPGADAAPHRPVPPSSALPEVPDGVRLVVPRPVGEGLMYRVHGSASAAGWLRDFRPAARLLVAGALGAAARGLRALHRDGTPAAEAGPVPGLRRLRDWAASDDALRRRARAFWGPDRTARLLDWAEQAGGPAADGVRRPVHGWASLGALIPPLNRGRTALLTGPDLGTGRPELDLGWLLGELAELAWRVPAHPDGGPAPDALALRRILLDAYGPGPDPVLTGRCAVLRIAVHMQDFARYQGWDEELLEYLAFTADLIDHEGRPTLPPSPGDPHEHP